MSRQSSLEEPSNQPQRGFTAELERPGYLREVFLRAARVQQAASLEIVQTAALDESGEILWQDAFDRLNRGVGESPFKSVRECGSGCTFCCHFANVDLMPLEALVIADDIRRNCSLEVCQSLRMRLAANVEKRRAVPPEMMGRMRLRCALLGDDGLCGVYSARPLACAGVFSASRQACQAIFDDTDMGQSSIPFDNPARAWMTGISGGLQRALVDAGLDANLYELNSAVLCALDHEDATQRWRRGDDLFADCICTDAHSPPRRQPVALRVDLPSQLESSFKRLRDRRRSRLRR